MLVIVDHGILRATGDTAFMLKANVVGLATSIVAVVLFTPYSVLLGAVGGYLVGVTVTRAFGLAKVAQRLELTAAEAAPWGTFARVAGAVAVSALAALPAFALPHPILRVGVGGALFGTVYAALVYRFELIPRGELLRLMRRFTPAWARS